MRAIGIMFSVLFVLAWAALVDGFVFVKLWLWFVIPVFGLPILSIPTAIGIGLLVEFLAKPLPKAEKKEWSEAMLNSFLMVTLKGAFVLTTAWIVTFWL